MDTGRAIRSEQRPPATGRAVVRAVSHGLAEEAKFLKIPVFRASERGHHARSLNCIWLVH